MASWWLIAGMALLTFIPRYLPLRFAGRLQIPRELERALNYVPIAVLTAIVVQATLIQHGGIDASLHNHRLIAALCAFATALIWRRLFLTVVVGLATFALVGWLG
ncbi:AzlD domain-containing protein [Mangrovitalea sediminis]|uniref:AzlD domain-containing protein n=1 Tax=Mangrovitalea sediminis TaxID=1982043 RepID=UPI000BE5F3FB|nr:AzlD domain-containing protein [Mangrovitalea sediminis]